MNERNKKVYAITIAVLLVLSIATSFLPSFQVLAYDNSYSNQYFLKDLSFLNDITSSKLFTQSDYLNGLYNPSNISNYGEDVLKNAQDENSGTTFFFDDVGYASFYEQVVNFFDNKSSPGSFSNAFNDIYFYSQASNTSNNYKIMNDFFTHPDNYTYYYIIYADGFSNNNPKLYIDFYISTGTFSAIAMPGSGYVFNSTQTIFNLHNCLTGDVDNNNSNSISLLPRSTSGGWGGTVGVNNLCLYSNIPTYFAFEDNGISGIDYSEYSNKLAIRDALANGDTSPFFIDRRMLLSAYTGIPNYNVNNDPLSQNNVGVYDFDFYPSGDVTSGVLNIDNLQLSAKTSEMDNVHLYALITYNFQCNGFYYEYGTNAGLVENYILNNMNTKPSRFNIRNVNILETTIDLDDTTYQTFSSRSIMKDTGPTDGEKYSIYIEDGIPRSIDMFDLYGISNYCQFVASTQTTPTTKVGNISSSVVTTFQVSCSIKIDYNDGQVSKTLATNTYDYLTGNNYKYGLTSTDNNTPADDMPSTVTDGLQWINNGGFGNGVGGNTVNGGSNSNSNTNSNNPSFTNNNNPTINIENNNTGGGFGTPETQNGMIEEIWSIWSSWQFLKDITQEVAENDFIQFVFSGDLYQLPLMNIVIPAVAVIVFISIASTVIRFIRGN